MELTEFVAAAIIAVFAMVGGALLNAAVTAPKNCQKVLSRLFEWFLPFSIGGIVVLIFAIAHTYWNDSIYTLMYSPLLWLVCSQAIFIATLNLAWMFTEAAKNKDGENGTE